MKRSLVSVLVPSAIQRRYAAKFVVSFALVLVAIVVVGAIGYAEVNTTIEQETQQSLESQATVQADALSEWSKRMSAQTRAVAQHEDVNAPDEREVRTALDVAIARGDARGAAGIHVVDTSRNRVVASTGGDELHAGKPLREIDDPWAVDDIGQLAAEQNVWISDGSYESQAVQGRTVLAFAVTAPHPDRVVVLEGAVDVRVSQLHQGQVNQTTAIVNADGEYVIQPEGQDRERVTDRRSQELIQATLETGDVRFHDDGETISAYAPVTGVSPDNQFVAISSTPHKDAYAVRDAVGQNVVFVVLVAMLALSLVGVVLGRQTVTPLVRLRDRTEAMEAGDLDVDLQTNRTDEIGQLYGAFDRMRGSLQRKIEDARVARDEAQAERERVRRINDALEQTAAEYSEVMGRAAAGDLTARIDADSENDAMASIATDFNEMLATLEQTVAELGAFATEVATASEQVTASSEEVRSASEQISGSVQEISAGAERQHDSLQAVDSEMADLSTTTEEIAAASNQVADIAERTATTGTEGREAAQAAIEGMQSVQRGSSDAVAEISELETQVEQIDGLVERIQEIADQTNMLALNANIEASRSASDEDADAGFGVVAQEVKELSDDVKDTAGEVERRLESIREQTRASAREVQQTSSEVDEASDRVAEAVEALEEIASFADRTHAGVQDISAATEQQAASTEEIVSMVDHATSISEETTSESENVAAAAEEQTSALTAVSRSASDLSEQAAQLSAALDRFETDAAGGERSTESLLAGQSDAIDDSYGGANDAGADPVDLDTFQPGVDAADFGTDRAADSGRQRAADSGRTGTEGDGSEGARDGESERAADDAGTDEDATDDRSGSETSAPGRDAAAGGADESDAGESETDQRRQEAAEREAAEQGTSGQETSRSGPNDSNGDESGEGGSEASPPTWATRNETDGRDESADTGQATVSTTPTDRTGADVLGGSETQAATAVEVERPVDGEDAQRDAAEASTADDVVPADTADDPASSSVEHDAAAVDEDSVAESDDVESDSDESASVEEDERDSVESHESDSVEGHESDSDESATGEDTDTASAETAQSTTVDESAASDEEQATADVEANDATTADEDESTISDGADVAESVDTADGDERGFSRHSEGDATSAEDATSDRSLTDLYGVGTATAQALRDAGLESVADVRAASHDELASVEGIGDVRATELKDDVEE